MKQTNNIPAQMAATLSLAWTGEKLNQSTTRDFAEDEELCRYFSSCYTCALDSVFNKSFPIHPIHFEPFFGDHSTVFIGSTGNDSAKNGIFRTDAAYFLFDSEDEIETHLLQIHIRPNKLGAGIDQDLLGAFCAYAHRFIAMNDGTLQEDEQADTALRLWRAALCQRRTGRFRHLTTKRCYALPHSVFSTISLFGMERAKFEARSEYAQMVYSLLNLQPNGVDLEIACDTTSRGTGWRSTDFFEAWLQPGSAVVMSTGYPAETFDKKLADCELFLKFVEEQKTEAAAANLEQQSYFKEPNLSQYDFIPEYPPLRYVVPVAALYGLLYEEILRDTYERLLEMSKSPKHYVVTRFAQAFMDVREIRRLTRRLSRIETLEHLRLPVSRPLGDTIIEGKLQHQVSNAIDELRANNLALMAQWVATLSAVLAIIGTIIALVALKG